MLVTEQERSLRRRIVFNAMNGNATPQAIKSAINTLEAEFGDVENIRFNQLIIRLQETLDSTEANLGKVLGQIMALRSLPPEQIGPDPKSSGVIGQASPSRTAPPPATPLRTGLHAVFATLLETIVMNLAYRSDDSDAKLIGVLIASPEINALGPRFTTPLRHWAQASPPTPLNIMGTPDQYRLVVHLVYVWLCQKLGPVDADRLLSAAVSKADSIPEAVTNSAKQLL